MRLRSLKPSYDSPTTERKVDLDPIDMAVLLLICTQSQDYDEICEAVANEYGVTKVRVRSSIKKLRKRARLLFSNMAIKRVWPREGVCERLKELFAQ